MTKRCWKFVATVGLALFLAALLGPQFASPRPEPKDQELIETLQEPHAVVDWDEDGLWLEEGRRAELPDASPLPLSSPLLEQAMARGVEITPDGRVIGLLKIHHWCGNDPVRLHLARVNLAHLMTYTRTEPSNPRTHRKLAECGWNVSRYCQFLSEQKLAMMTKP